MWLITALMHFSFFWDKASVFVKRVFIFFFRKVYFLDLKYPECFKVQYPNTYPIAYQITSEIISELKRKDLSSLASNAPGLENYDWESYLNSSLIRMLKVSEFLGKVGTNLKILDIGSYFGNFALFCSKLGHSVEVVDSYRGYKGAFEFILGKFKRNGIIIHEIADVGYDLTGLSEKSYDVVLCLSVIEHIPHTPRLLMEAINRVLKDSGHLILETPNLAYIYNRQKLICGFSIHAPLQVQYFTQIPFQGHHREYTIDEIRWILQENKFVEIFLDTYSYSLYSLPYLNGMDLLNYVKMRTDKTSRELIIALARKQPQRNQIL